MHRTNAGWRQRSSRRATAAVLAACLLTTACSGTPAQEYVALRDKIANEVQALVRDAPSSDVMDVTAPELQRVANHVALLDAYARGLHKLELPAGADEGCRDELVAATWKVVDSSVRVFYDKPEDLDALIATLKLC
jgi:hypothetical protein